MFTSVLLRNSTGGGAAFAPPALAFARITQPIYERVFFYPAKVTWRFARVKFSGANINKRVVDPTSTVELTSITAKASAASLKREGDDVWQINRMRPVRVPKQVSERKSATKKARRL